MKELISAEQLDAGIRKMAEQITRTVGDRPLTVIGVLTGSVVLLADLIRQLKMPLRVGFVQASSYQGHVERGQLELDTAILHANLSSQSATRRVARSGTRWKSPYPFSQFAKS